tara:strand:+ start:5747 stop:5869 length:123 start_codon:yes stop_codon:yes gene_type:complete
MSGVGESAKRIKNLSTDNAAIQIGLNPAKASAYSRSDVKP